MEEFAKTYLEILNNDLAGINLTRINTFDEFYAKQILDSINPIVESPSFLKRAQKVHAIVDIGFGGGFPLLPLAYKFPDLQFIGFEAKSKKVKAVKYICEQLKIKNVAIFHQRYEDIIFNKPSLVTFKAVGKIPAILERFNVAAKVSAYFYKGPGFMEQDKIEDMDNDWQQFENIEINIPLVEKRHLIGFEKDFVPHGTIEKSKKKLVRLSDFL